jgi:Flp pilus assembly pilin Flp
MKEKAQRMHQDETGAGAAEYLLVLGIIVIVVAAVFYKQIGPAIEKLGTSISDLLGGTTDTVNQAPSDLPTN